MKTYLLAASLALAATIPAHAREPLMNPAMEGKWALGNAANCGIPSKTYVLAMNADNDTIIWQDGFGNMDVERVIYNDMREFRTRTLQSLHQRRGHPVGTGWIYEEISAGVLRITKTGSSAFFAVRCNSWANEGEGKTCRTG